MAIYEGLKPSGIKSGEQPRPAKLISQSHVIHHIIIFFLFSCPYALRARRAGAAGTRVVKPFEAEAMLSTAGLAASVVGATAVAVAFFFAAELAEFAAPAPSNAANIPASCEPASTPGGNPDAVEFDFAPVAEVVEFPAAFGVSPVSVGDSLAGAFGVAAAVEFPAALGASPPFAASLLLGVIVIPVSPPRFVTCPDVSVVIPFSSSTIVVPSGFTAVR